MPRPAPGEEAPACIKEVRLRFGGTPSNRGMDERKARCVVHDEEPEPAHRPPIHFTCLRWINIRTDQEEYSGMRLLRLP